VKAKLRNQMRTFISNSLVELESKMKRAKLEEVPEVRPRGQSEQIFSTSNTIDLNSIRYIAPAQSGPKSVQENSILADNVQEPLRDSEKAYESTLSFSA
jgi:hypothetical protein